jgi:hypothetical protein
VLSEVLTSTLDSQCATVTLRTLRNTECSSLIRTILVDLLRNRVETSSGRADSWLNVKGSNSVDSGVVLRLRSPKRIHFAFGDPVDETAPR